MAQKIMANIDVKLGIKSILLRVEAAYTRRSQVNDMRSRRPCIQLTYFRFSFEGDQNMQTDAIGCE